MDIAAALNQQGYVFLPSYLPALSGTDVAVKLGVPVALGVGPAVHLLKPLREDETTPNSYSGLFGYGKFPFHSDLAHWKRPPRFLFLRALVGYSVVPTLLIDGNMLISQIGVRTMQRSLVKPRRPVQGAMPLMRLYDEIGAEKLIRWDQTFIRPAGASGRSGFAQMQAALQKTEPISVALSAPGDTLIIDNWRMLHARAPVPAECKDRLLERAYLEGVR